MNCACGRPLHYNSSYVQDMVTRLAQRLGETVIVSVGGRRYKVQRHYLALHGLKAKELPQLAEQGIVKEVK